MGIGVVTSGILLRGHGAKHLIWLGGSIGAISNISARKTKLQEIIPINGSLDDFKKELNNIKYYKIYLD